MVQLNGHAGGRLGEHALDLEPAMVNGDAVLDGAVAGVSDFRKVLGMFATGVTVVTAGGEYMHGMTANAFTSVSLRPPLILVCVARSARMHGSILGAGTFAVSVLTENQEGTARYFSDRSRPSGAAQFSGDEWVRGLRTGAPVLTSCSAWLECDLSAAYDGGDHSVFLGQVLRMQRNAGAGALTFFDGEFHRLHGKGEWERDDSEERS